MRGTHRNASFVAAAILTSSLVVAPQATVAQPLSVKPPATALMWGNAGTLDTTHEALPSGQSFGVRAVQDWAFEPGMGPWFSDITDDGTIFAMNVQTAGNIFVRSGHGMHVTAFNPDQDYFQNVAIKTDRGVTKPVTPQGDPVAANILDVATLNNGEAVAFTGDFPHGGQDLETQGLLPTFGIVTQAPDGTWEVAEGAGWRNAWSPRELYDATVAADPVNGPALADKACPKDVTLNERVFCRWTNEIAFLPESNAVVIAHYAPFLVSVLEIDGPDANGRYDVRIAAVHETTDPRTARLTGEHLPGRVDDPSWPDEFPDRPDCPSSPAGAQLDGLAAFLAGSGAPPEEDRWIGLAPREVQSDPTSTLSDERFALHNDAFAWRYQNFTRVDGEVIQCPLPQIIGTGLIEYRYDESAPVNDRIQPVSPPVLLGAITGPPEPQTGLNRFREGGIMHYDQQGNLWVTGHDNNDRSVLWVYANTPTGRTITQSPCVSAGTPFEEYVAQAPGVRSLWGRVCAPDYRISQIATISPFLFRIQEDPDTGNIITSNLFNSDFIVIDPEGSGTNMTFRVSNIADIKSRRPATQQPVSGPCASDPNQTCTGVPLASTMLGPVDASGRVWSFVHRAVPGNIKADDPGVRQMQLGAWAFSGQLSDLFAPAHSIGRAAGSQTYIHAEMTDTAATTQVSGAVAVKDVHSVAGVIRCRQDNRTACTDPVSGMRGGFALGDPTSRVPGGAPPALVAEYSLDLLSGGRYQVEYQATDRDAEGPEARILLTAPDGKQYTTVIPVSASMPNEPHQGPEITITPGVRRIKVEVPGTNGGWELDWIRLTKK